MPSRLGPTHAQMALPPHNLLPTGCPLAACLWCSVFFISHDDRFMIKTMHKEEIKLLLRWAGSPMSQRLASLQVHSLASLQLEHEAWLLRTRSPQCRTVPAEPPVCGALHATHRVCCAMPPPRSMLPKYYRHVQANPGTLLTRFYGVHRVKPSHGRKVGETGGGNATVSSGACPRQPCVRVRLCVLDRQVAREWDSCYMQPAPPHALQLQPPLQVRFVVMNNVFRTDLDLHRKFDLKGSTYGRTAGPKPGATGEQAGAARKEEGKTE